MLHMATESLTKTWMPIKEDWALCYKNSKFTLGESDQQQARKLEWQDKDRLFKVCQFGHVLFRILRGSACSAR